MTTRKNESSICADRRRTTIAGPATDCPGRSVFAAALLLVLLVLAPRASAVINPRFTPLHLVKGSAQVQWLRLSEPQGNTATAEIVEILKGKAETGRIEFALSRDLDLKDIKSAFFGKPTAGAILFLSEKSDQADPDEPDGALEVGTFWFAIFRQDGKLTIARDERQFFAVWGGSARMLAAATRYVQADPTAHFPVRSDLTWGEALKLGQLAGPASGCRLVDLEKPSGLLVLVMSETGDRLYRPAPEGKEPADVTAQLKLATKSKAVALGDFDGDGRVDLVSWTGGSLQLAAQTTEGTFAAPKEISQLAECLSLDSVESGGPRPALLAGTGQGPVLLVMDNAGKFQLGKMAGDQASLEKLGPGGLCVVGNFTGDGHTDVFALFAKGALLYAGEGQGRFKSPVLLSLPLVEQPRSALCGDFDADGWLDVLVAGNDGLALLSRESADQWSNLTFITGELAYHGNANQPRILACAPCDVNTDGRQGMALFYADRKPLLFFNRGFSTFGWARELDLNPAASAADGGFPSAAGGQPEPDLKPPEDLLSGQTAGVVADLNSDGLPDLLAVGAKAHEVWVLFGRREEGLASRNCFLSLPPSAAGPLTVTVRNENRIAGMYVVPPGMPAMVGRPEAGPMPLEWNGPDGKPLKRQVEVIDEGSRFEIGP